MVCVCVRSTMNPENIIFFMNLLNFMRLKDFHFFLSTFIFIGIYGGKCFENSIPMVFG